jgi:peptide deformylase
VYTADRILENLITVINPIILSASTEEVEGWEACFSAKFSTGESIAAYLPRHREITVQYMDIEGDVKENKLKGFAAKVFQHEFDHLQGIVNINHKKIIENRNFTNQADFEKFMQIVRENDAKAYLP